LIALAASNRLVGIFAQLIVNLSLSLRLRLQLRGQGQQMAAICAAAPRESSARDQFKRPPMLRMPPVLFHELRTVVQIFGLSAAVFAKSPIIRWRTSVDELASCCSAALAKLHGAIDHERERFGIGYGVDSRDGILYGVPSKSVPSVGPEAHYVWFARHRQGQRKAGGFTQSGSVAARSKSTFVAASFSACQA